MTRPSGRCSGGRSVAAEGEDIEAQCRPAVKGHEQGLQQGNNNGAHGGHATIAWRRTSMIRGEPSFCRHKTLASDGPALSALDSLRRV